MAVTTIIARGKLVRRFGEYWLSNDDKTEKLSWLIREYVGQTLVILVEEPEEELDPIISKRLRMALA